MIQQDSGHSKEQAYGSTLEFDSAMGLAQLFKKRHSVNGGRDPLNQPDLYQRHLWADIMRGIELNNCRRRVIPYV